MELFYVSVRQNLRRPQRIAFFCITILLIVAIIALPVYFLTHESIARGAITTNGHECSAIGASILDKGGSAVDAAIAALFCEGVAMPQSMGLGGGFLMTIYDKATNSMHALNAREIAPLAATVDMMGGDARRAQKGGLSVAVPGEIRGYKAAHARFGRLAWRELIQPTIDLCNDGILVTEYIARMLLAQEHQIRADAYLNATFVSNTTGKLYRENEKVKRTLLAHTLQVLADEPDAVNNGSLTRQFVADIAEKGGIIVAEDLSSYEPKWMKPVRVSLPNGETLYTSPLPGSGVILSLILNIAKNYINFNESYDSVVNTQRIVESLKFGYGKRSVLGDLKTMEMKQLLEDLESEEYAKNITKGKLFDTKTFSDPAYYGGVAVVPEDHGTAHISVLAANGDAVSVTSTINLYFGAGFMSKSTGIILNDEMDDFSSPNITNEFGLPPSENNYITPGKHPISSMCPSIVLDKNGDVRLIIGAAGGSKITSCVALAVIKNLWYGMNVQDAVSSPRYHHQLYPMQLQLEASFKAAYSEVVEKLESYGHNTTVKDSSGFSAITSIGIDQKRISLATDPRRPGRKTTVY